MVRISLECAIVGHAGTFDVTIDDGEKVSVLKKVIWKKIEAKFVSDERFKGVVPMDLLLFLTKKDGAWLTEADVKKGVEDTTGFTPLDVGGAPLNLVNLSEVDVRCQLTKEAVKAKKTPVHVLVVVPKRDGTSNEMSAVTTPLTVEKIVEQVAEQVAEQVEMSVNKAFRERDEKASAYSFSDLNIAMKERIVKKMRLTENIPDVKEPKDESIAGYSWIPKIAESEESQRAGYMAYLQQHLKTLIDRGDFLLDDIAGDKEVLNIVDPRLPFAMNGTADVLLINRTSKNPLIPLAGVSLVIELKMKVEPCHVPQAIGQLVSSSMKAPLNCYPLSLLTDLNDHWHFSWFSDKHVLTQVTLQYPKNAFAFIEAAVLRQIESPPLPPSFIPGPFKTIKVDDFLPQPYDDRADEMMERYELMADVVEPEFLLARRMEYAQHVVQSMPMYAHMYA